MLASERVGRSYIAAIPDFLKNRPAPFIQHCMTKIDFAETVEETDIIQLSTNCFKIKSVSDSRKKLEYNVLLDNGHGMPSCVDLDSSPMQTYICSHYCQISWSYMEEHPLELQQLAFFHVRF